jgi:predicted oxidoreductase
MKIKLLMAGLLGLVSATTFAQKGELNTAKEEYENIRRIKGSAQWPMAG